MKRILSFFLLSFAFVNAFAQAPAGYYNAANGLTGASLKTALKAIITSGHQDKGYGGLWIAYQTTDRDLNTNFENDGTILDIYSENPNGQDPYNFTVGTNQCGTYSQEGNCYNREHIVPQSLFNSASPMVADVHFIRATDGKVNSVRSNYPFGKVGSATSTSQNGSKLGNSVSPGYGGTVFEPIDAFKGDVARMIFYFVTRYEDKLSTFSTGNLLGGSAFPGLQKWELDQLLQWNAMDPVSPEEVNRNNASYTFQGNRNPFIDNPAYVDLIWGTTAVDNQAPTTPTNLTTNTPTSNSISLSWTASTDNVGVTTYDIYVDNVLKSSVSGTSTTATVSGLQPLTSYTFNIIAKDAAGNSSPKSNPATGTTIDGPAGGSCGTEDFSTMQDGSALPTSYATRTWTNNGITWTATSARTDQTINDKAITIQGGDLSSTTISGGIQKITLTTQRKFTGGSGNLNVLVNNNVVGTIPYSASVVTSSIDVNISGNATIKIVNPSGSNRVAIDDLSWTCYSGSLATSESKKDKSEFTIFPNPVRNNELFVKGENLNKISKAQIYDLSGKMIETLDNPFKHSNKINLKGLVKGTYLLKTDNFSTKFIVE
ncbi:endonuclease [Chryseobacterium sp.]|uniref:endonuclease n=1 Tax=Chryseobacterium sp. TaxID=1871047 RepID=UPI0032194074